MNDSSIVTMTGKCNNTHRSTETKRIAVEKQQQNAEENSRESKVSESTPELICFKQEPHDVVVKEEMVLENEQHFEEPVLANRIKKRWHEFGLELPQPLPYDEGFVKQEALDEFSQESSLQASCSSLDSTTLPELVKCDQELQKQAFRDSSSLQDTATCVQQESEMVFSKEEEERTAQKCRRRMSPRNSMKQLQSLEMISAFNEEHLEHLHNSLRSESECFDQLHLKEMENSAVKTLLLEKEELYKNRERVRKAIARANENPQQRRRRLDKMCLYINQKRATENSEERDERLLKLRLREAERRANETPEQRSYRLNQNRLYARKRRASQTQEERVQHLIQGRLYEAQRRANESPEEREQRLIRMRLSEAKRRANESPDERERRLVRTRITEAERRANETPDARNQRLIRMRLSEARRRANETPEARTNRLARTRMNEARRRANETPEERDRRLIRMRLSEAQRRANETPEEREHRLLRMRLNEAQRRANETPEERENRLNRMRFNEARRRASETSEEREQRLSRLRWSVAQHKVNELSGEQELNRIPFDMVNETAVTYENYLLRSHFSDTQLHANITREEQIKNLNMYFSIAKKIENKPVEQHERYSEQVDFGSGQYVPKEQEQFLLNMHLSKIQEGKT